MRTVMLGAGGKLGTLLRARWPSDAAWTTRATVDIEDQAALSRAVEGADAVFCFAGVTPGGNGPMHRNVSLAKRTLDAANGARVFLFSSAAVYGALPGMLPESGAVSPQSDYARAKLDMETMAANHTNPCVVLRLGNVAGADAILGGWRAGFVLDQFADGQTPARSYVGPGALARVLHQLAALDRLPDVLNVAAPGTVEMGDLLDAATLSWTPRPATERTIAKVHLDTSALEQFVTFAPHETTALGIVQDWRNECSA